MVTASSGAFSSKVAYNLSIDHKEFMQDHLDQSVQETNDDATISKWSAVRAGYYHDPFVRYFCSPGSPKRSPLINRGYYLRIQALRSLILRFAATFGSQGAQVVSLGAGFDTMYWWLRSNGVSFAQYVEIDFPDVIRRKVRTIKRHPVFEEAFLPEDRPSIESCVDEIHTAHYHLMPCDLRSRESLRSILPYVDSRQPVLFISECVLIYLENEQVCDVMRFASQTFDRCLFFIYEQILPYDPFGQMMVKNLIDRGCPLLSIHECPDKKAQLQRYTNVGFPHGMCLDMNEYERQSLSLPDRQQLAKVELLDELEEYEILMAHYCVAVGASSAQLLEVASNAWDARER
jgi:hypothetical protein